MATNIQRKQETLPITGMTCANCAATIERNVRKLPGIEVANERLNITYDLAAVSHDDIVARVRKAGYDVPQVVAGEEVEDAEARTRQADIDHQWRRLIIGASFAIPRPAQNRLQANAIFILCPIFNLSPPKYRPNSLQA